MDANTARFVEQMKKDPAKLRKILSSPEGQSLMQMLSQGKQGSDLQQAMQAASGGNPAGAMKMIQKYLKTPDGAALANHIQQMFRK